MNIWALVAVLLILVLLPGELFPGETIVELVVLVVLCIVGLYNGNNSRGQINSAPIRGQIIDNRPGRVISTTPKTVRTVADTFRRRK